MISTLRQQRGTSLLLILIFLSSYSSFAAEPQTQTALPGGTAPVNPGAAMAAPTLDMGSVTPPQMPQQEPDRKSGADASKALAIAGAAMAGFSCIMMMREAMKLPPGEERSKMMAQAMQQCAQAAQSAAAAAKNDDAKKAVSQNDIPKQSELKMPKPLEAKNNGSENTALPSTETTSEGEPLNVDDITMPQALDTTGTLATGEMSPTTDLSTGFNFKEVSISTPKSVETAKADYNEEAKNSNSNANANAISAGYGGGNFAGTKGISSDELKKVTAEIYGGSASGQKKIKAADGGAGEGGSGGGSEGSKEEGPSAFDQMLSQLMGGNNPAAEQAMGAGGLDVVVLPKDPKTKAGPNIFDYASYRYRVATYNDGRIKPKITAKNDTIPTTKIAKLTNP